MISLIFLFSIPIVFADWQNTPFIRGEIDQTGGLVSMGDVYFLLNWLFLGGEAPRCLDSADWNDDGRIDISDAISLGYYAISPRGGGEPTIIDPTADKLDCKYFNMK